MVGAGRFERPTPCAQGRCATRLRYAPTFAALFILKHFLTRRTPRRGQKLPKQALLWQNRDKTPSVGPLRVETPAALIRLPVQLLQRLPFHLQLHLGILLEHLGVSLPEQLSHPLVRHTAGAQARRVRGTEVVDAEVWHLRSPQSGMPHRLQSHLVSARVFVTRKQPRTLSRESQLIPKRIDGD